MRAVLRKAVSEGVLRSINLGEGVSQLVGPLLFHRVILHEALSPDFPRRLVADFLTAHGPQ